MDQRKEIALLAMCVHGALAALHTLGVVYNLRRRNWREVAIHVVALSFDAKSALEHLYEAKDENNKNQASERH